MIMFTLSNHQAEGLCMPYRPNESCQPAPGERLVCSPTTLIRRGCSLR